MGSHVQHGTPEKIACKQYGSQNHRVAGTQCLNKQLFYDYIQAMHILAALCSNDAKSCYDWIVLLIAALCLCHLGAPVQVVISMTSMLTQLCHHVQSAFKNSAISQGQEN